jgi:hypothetical protein
MAIFARRGNAQRVSVYRVALANLAIGQGDWVAARAASEENLRESLAAGNPRNAAMARCKLGAASVYGGSVQEGRRLLVETIAELRRWRLGGHLADALHHLGDADLRLEQFREAGESYRESIRIRQPLGERLGIAIAIENLSWVARSLGEPRRAVRLSAAAAATRVRVGGVQHPSQHRSHQRLLEELRAALGRDALF